LVIEISPINSYSLDLNKNKEGLSNFESGKIKKIINYLLMKDHNLDQVFSFDLAKTIFYQCNASFLNEFAKNLKEILDQIDLASIDKKQELFIAHIIALIPYTYPQVGDCFVIPVRNDDGFYQRMSYVCEKIIPISLSNSLTPLKAYSFHREDGKSALIFTGSTFPSGGGFLNALFADFTAFSSVGKLPFYLGLDQLSEYFKDHDKVMLYGMSLGGSLCLHTFNAFESKIQDIHVVVPAGLHLWDRFNKASDKKIVIITQEGDVISHLGYFPEHENSQLYHLKVTSGSRNGLQAHARAFSGSADVEIEKKNVRQVNRGFLRRLVTITHIALGWLIFLSLLPFLAVYKLKDLVFHCVKKAYSSLGFEKPVLSTSVES